jgi:predicted acyl esterase
VYNAEVVNLQIQILDAATRFEAGEKLVIDIRGYDQIAGAGMIPQHPENRNRGRHVIHTGGEYASSLLLPFVPLAN